LNAAVRHKEIFVYGTLMSGEMYSEFMERGDLKRLCPARCLGRLYDLGDYPGMIPGGNLWIAGELYRSSAIEKLLPILDELEGSHAFERRLVEVDWTHGPTPAWCWVYTGPVDPSSRIDGGSWRAHRRRQKRHG
jgi:gamma-glutamylcyclotransferase (GGCT)/AIG2-like uncharacterized protein YtfP